METLYTVVETPEFQRQSKVVWNEDDHDEFVDWIARFPEAGDVIPGADGARKVRWRASGHGKRGGARVIYFNQLADGFLVLIAVYAKSETENVPTKKVRKVKREAQEH